MATCVNIDIKIFSKCFLYRNIFIVNQYKLLIKYHMIISLVKLFLFIEFPFGGKINELFRLDNATNLRLNFCMKVLTKILARLSVKISKIDIFSR